jgi:hypothetical protein
MGNRWVTGLVMVGVGVGAAVLAFFGLLQWQHWRQDEANVHGLVQIVNYNIQQGKLLPLPDAPAPPGPKP